MTKATEQERAEFPSPALLTKLQTSTEGGAILVDGYAGGYDLLTEIWRVIVADEAARRAQAVAVPQGWKLVPDADNMTDEQAEAVAEIARVCGGGALDIYRAALAAAPQPPEAVPVRKPLATHGIK